MTRPASGIDVLGEHFTGADALQPAGADLVFQRAVLSREPAVVVKELLSEFSRSG
jgi:hypothetical protein